jgi:hypothetical protein
VANLFERFERLSELYVHFHQKPIWSCGLNCEEDPWDSLRIFLAGYAFQHRDGAESWAYAAFDAVTGDVGPLDEQAPERIWAKFISLVEDPSEKQRSNPLCPVGTQYPGRSRANTTRRVSAVEFARKLPKPLIEWARSGIAADELQDASSHLTTINGISEQIAATFFRDISIRYGVTPTRRRELLQPVNQWIDRVTLRLAETIAKPQVTQYIMTHAQCPEKASQGIWYFCVYVAHSAEYAIDRAVSDEGYFNWLVRGHLNRVVEGAPIAQHCLRDWGLQQAR